MQRIKYTLLLEKRGLRTEIYDIYARKIIIEFIGSSPVKVSISRGDKIIMFNQSSLQNAKRKVRKILQEEFEVNLGDEVRSKLCI